MHTRHTTIASLGILVTAGFWQMAGCSASADDCGRNNICLEDGKPFGSVVEPPPGCAASPKDDRDVIKDECGFFVSVAGDDANAGTADKPFKTVGKAVDAAKSAKARVYACADGTYAERVEIPAGVSVFGGFTCMSGAWNYDAPTGATIEPTAPGPDDVQATLRVTGTGASQLEDLVVRASDAGFAGGSSIAVIVNAVTVNFARTELIAGTGAAGAQGATPSDSVGSDDPDDMSVRGTNGQAACMGGVGGNPGGASKVNPICGESSGGKGGNGQENTGDAGGDGIPAPNPNPTDKGIGGLGDTGAGDCEIGQPGANGVSLDDGTGAQGDGALDATKGYVGESGQPGQKGTVGQGGGGGGGSKGKSACFGASGGSGGAGGCGGNGGLGGIAGGSSIGIVSLGATLSFNMVDITTGAGGQGGDGGFGQAGGAGGNGGNGGNGVSMGGPTPSGCNGGKGGNGGNGSNGGGGRGGHSIGIAHKGGNVSDAGVMIVTGAAGMGGMGGGATGGVEAPMHAFP